MFVKRVLILLTMFILTVLLKSDACLAASSLPLCYTDSVAFYKEYGSGRLVFYNGGIYYGSRGAVGDASGIRYSVCGQRFTIHTDDGQELSCGVALEQSCKRISYKTVDGYRYSLYQLSYSTLLQRFHAKYPGIGFDEILFNQNVLLTADFYLCIEDAGVPRGSLKEADNGDVTITGVVYNDYVHIVKAEHWSNATIDALSHYYDVQLTVFQPSSYWIHYVNNHPEASGIMKDQLLAYGESESLYGNQYEVKHKLVLDSGQAWKLRDEVSYEKGRQLKQRSCELIISERFLGWAERPSGMVSFLDEAMVKNLTRKHMDMLTLYGVWEAGFYQLPEAYATTMFSGKTTEKASTWCTLIFLGWSYERQEIYPAGTTASHVKECLLPGTRILVEEDVTLYGVWAYRKSRLILEKPPDSKKIKESHHYSLKLLKKIRKKIQEKGFMGAALNQALVKGGLL